MDVVIVTSWVRLCTCIIFLLLSAGSLLRISKSGNSGESGKSDPPKNCYEIYKQGRYLEDEIHDIFPTGRRSVRDQKPVNCNLKRGTWTVEYQILITGHILIECPPFNHPRQQHHFGSTLKDLFSNTNVNDRL